MLRTSIIQKRLYHINQIDERDYSPIVFERKEKLDKVKILLNEGCSEIIVFETLQIKRSTLYRWKKAYKIHGLSGLENEDRRPLRVRKKTWSVQVEKDIYHLRKQYPVWGKAKLTVLYNRNHTQKLSESTVGRILSKLVAKGVIMPVRKLLGRKERKKRVFSGHAQRWEYGMESTGPGDLIQVDHLTTSVPGIGTVKHFNAICPTTKYMVSQVYHEATSKNASDFFELIRQQFPFPILSIQVDGGSEFMAEFEKICMMYSVPLFVLPPRRPQYNGNVERMNGTTRTEFYTLYATASSLHILRNKLQKYDHLYNFVRPHMGIDLLTPHQFCETFKVRPQSHM
jgi:transposase